LFAICIAPMRVATLILSLIGTLADRCINRSVAQGLIIRDLSSRESMLHLLKALDRFRFCSGVSRTAPVPRGVVGSAHSMCRLYDRMICTSGTGRAVLLLA